MLDGLLILPHSLLILNDEAFRAKDFLTPEDPLLCFIASAGLPFKGYSQELRMGVNAYHMIQELGFGEPKLLTRWLGKNVLPSAKAEGSDFYLANLFWGVGGFVRVFSHGCMSA